jgi:hypothetical protein
METAVLVAWGIGLAGALLLTLPLLKLITTALHVLSELVTLSGLTRDAARRLAEHAEAVPALAALPDESRLIREGSRNVALAARLVEQQLSAAAARAGGDGG